MADAADSANVRLGADVAAPAALSPADVGAWQVLPFHSEVLAVHAALLPSGDVLFAAGSGNSLTRFQSPDFGDVAKKDLGQRGLGPDHQPAAWQRHQLLSPCYTS